MSISSRSVPHSAIRIRSGFWCGIVVFTVVTWLGAGAPLVLQPVVPLDPELLALPQFGPTLGVLAVLAVHHRRTRSRQALAGTVAVSLRPTGDVLLRSATGAGLLVVVFALCVGALMLTGQPLHLGSAGSAYPFWIVAILQLLGACGEELGWRSFLQPCLQTRYSTQISAMIVGLLWGSWHLQYYSLGIGFVSAFITSTVALSVIMGVLVRRSGTGSLLVAGTFHWLLNLGFLLLLDPDREVGRLVAMVFLAAAAVVVAVGVGAHAVWHDGPLR